MKIIRSGNPFIYLLVFWLTCFAVSDLKAQQSNVVVHFSSDSLVYFSQLESFMTSARAKEGKDFMKEFELYWMGGQFTDEQRQEVYLTSNLMLKNRKRAFPDFRDYIYSVLAFLDSETQRAQNYFVWNETLREILEKKARKGFDEYLEFSLTLFEDNVITKSKATTWRSDNDNYVFEFDSLPKITFESLKLTCYAKGDSAVIYKTSGSYYPTTYTWVGRSGLIDWQRAGFASDKVYATFNGYEINTRKTEFIIDTVIFYNKNYFGDKPLKGQLHEKILAATQSRRVSYPRFESFNRRLGIKNIYSDVDYEGGFAMYGENFIGKGTAEEQSKLTFYRNGEPFLLVLTEKFLIQKDRITSDKAAVRFYLQEDSIYHPGIQFKYFVENNTVSLIKDETTASSMSAYYNTFHMVDMQFEVLNWKTDEPRIEFTNIQGSTKREALFESFNFFSFRRYEQLQGMAHVNPLMQIRALSIKLDTARVIALSELARFMKLPSNQVELLLMDLSTRGIVDYNYGIKEFYIKDRLFNYVYARAGWKDYDIIQFYSAVKKGENASLNLDNLDLTIKGVENVFLSDSQQVIIFPTGGELVLKKNRDFNFAGVVKAGRLDFFGKEFSFEYDAFKVNLTNVDSLRMKAELPDIDAYGRNKLTQVRSVIQGINGELLIDEPRNKSGRKSIQKYPIFNSFKDSYVYYDRPEILDGAYKKDLYFHLDPFTIDSLDNFSNAGLRFDGEFESSGIFPVFREVLTLQPDYSLGFIRQAPPDGFPVYRGKGQFHNNINLSNKGLRGDGKIEYITSTTLSKDFIFYPDSMTTIADSYDIREQQEGVQFPHVSGGGVKVLWRPNNDVMFTDKRDSALAFYGGESYLHGRTILRPTGLSGAGVFEFERAELESKLIKFKYEVFDADTADFRLKDLELAGELSFKTTNVNAHVDFKKRFGQFKSNGGGSFIEFPANQYMSFMEEFNWYMDTESIELSAGSDQESPPDSSDVRLEGAEFVSTHPQQDSLNFYSTLAKYDLRQKVITARGVQYVNTADARILPDSGMVIVRKKAVMDPLENAGIIANTVTKYHNIYNATANIYGKRSYSATGYIDYVDETGNSQKIYLEKINVDSTMQTVGYGSISSTDGFTLSPFFEYRGAVGLAAKYEFLTFSGATRISHECNTLERNWIEFAAEIDPNNIYIPIEEDLKDQAGEDVLSSIMLGSDSTGVYSGFLTRQSNPRDIEVLLATGYLLYDKPSKEYRISNIDKLMEQSLSGNYLSLTTTSCKIYGEGMVNMGADLGQIDLQSAGNIIHTLNDDEVIFDLFMVFNFFIPDNAMQEMAKVLNANITLDPVKLDRPNYEKSLQELYGSELADKLISDISLYGSFKKFPAELNKTIILNEARFKFNKESNSYMSFGRIGIGNILKEQVNKYVSGKMEIVKRRSGDVLNMYLEAGSGNWFFFSYSRGIMFTVSSNEVFNNAIKEVKPDKAKLDTKKKETPYKFMITTERKKNDFLKRFDIN